MPTFVCTRGQPCRGEGKPAKVKGGRVECPVCGRVNVATYETADGRLLVLPHR